MEEREAPASFRELALCHPMETSLHRAIRIDPGEVRNGIKRVRLTASEIGRRDSMPFRDQPIRSESEPWPYPYPGRHWFARTKL